MSDVEQIKAEIKRLSARATAAKMELHDFSEELPKDWDKIPEVAARVHAVFADLAARRAELKRLETT
ncbi:conserved protein of unknown function [Rhodovastum atsumiense]|uniref:Uncharacterized protein n=1 Tax=Rhodovastum atsumiense TaxID=504468 RepID=A0A5M6IZ62_9PROT|nr:CCE_0567 family metalloprotein [Rhodovastum atsumiense]KAA5613622.1 hypothetical protein F1189_04195 [Rhodovastum atsumiense]CAH2599526.1 conserved protein of unknown function [Rhodovastum atsumiense]